VEEGARAEGIGMCSGRRRGLNKPNLFMGIGEDGVGLGTNGFVRVFSVQGRSAGFGCRRSLFGWVAE
jgi:hypothetical protein